MPYNIQKKILVKNDDAYVKSSFQMPATHYHTYSCYNPAVIDAVREYISPEAFEMISAGDIKGAIRSLGGSSTHVSIIDLVTGQKKKELEFINNRLKRYECDNFSDDEDSDQEKADDGAGPSDPRQLHTAKLRKREERRQKWLEKKKEIEGKIKTLTERFQNILDDNCAICCDTMTQPIMLPCCQNIFCGNCIFSCLKTQKTCPMCRAPVKLSNLVHLDNENENENDDPLPERVEEEKLPTKPEMVVKLIKKIQRDKQDSRTIIFSGHNASFDIIKRYLDDSSIEYKEVRGSAVERKNTIEKYKKGKISVIFLNSTYNGAGINLQETSDIILYHEMSEHIRTQIIGRANRLGRYQDLDVHELR